MNNVYHIDKLHDNDQRPHLKEHDGNVTFHSCDIKNQSCLTKEVISITFDHVYILPYNDISIRAKSSTILLNALSLDVIYGEIYPL
jgi:hypothetical protein